MENLAELLNRSPSVNSYAKCGHCGLRPKHKDRSWCKRCIRIYHNRQNWTNQRMEKHIISQVGERYADAELYNLPKEIKQQLKDYKGLRDLYLYGNIGSGKTYTMAALLKLYTFEGFDCIRINFDDFCVQVRSTFSRAAKQTERDIVKPLMECDMLFIDDLALRARAESDFAYVTLYTLLNKRQEKLLPTILSSNKSIDQLEKTFDSRVGSRLKLALEIKYTGKDLRRVCE